MPTNQTTIAVVAEKSSNLSGGVVVVYAEIGLEYVLMTSTDWALVILLLQQLIVLLNRDTIKTFEITLPGQEP